jgi:AcrR family transcriptional regulator
VAQPPSLRKDAEENRQRLLAAARELFAERGLDVTLNDIARHAGVGVGTAYRRFTNKEEVIDALFVRQTEEVAALARQCLAEPDPWRGLTNYLEQCLAMQLKDRGLAQMLNGRRRPEQHDWARDTLAPLVNAMVDRTRDSGQLRSGVVGTDLVFVQAALSTILDLTRDQAPDLHRRYLWILLDGLRADQNDRAPLPVDPLTLDETHEIMGRHYVRTRPDRRGGQ